MMSAQNGMSSPSLLIVVIVATVTVVLIATAIPSYLTSNRAGEPPAPAAKLKASEAGVLGALRVITEAENTSALTGTTGNFATYHELRAGGLIDSAFSETGVRGGYRYTVSIGTSGHAFCASATRLSSEYGDLAYTVSQQGAIYQMAGDTAPACNAETGQITSGSMLGR